MKITILGGGNIGKAIAFGFSQSGVFLNENITVVDVKEENILEIKQYNKDINAVLSDYSFIEDADIVLLGVKPWSVEEVLKEHKDKFNWKKQILVSVAAGIKISQLSSFTSEKATIFRIIPNTAMSVLKSMSYITSVNATEEQKKLILKMFSELGKAEFIEEEKFSAVTAIASCGIAYALKYIQASIEGGKEIGLTEEQTLRGIIQTIEGAIALLEHTKNPPQVEIDKVSTPGGLTLKGLAAMEKNNFTNSIIEGLKASNI